MAEDQRSRGEQWSSMYHNPEYDLARYEETNHMLIVDLRRVITIGIIGVAAFAIVLMATGRVDSGLNFLMIAGAPLVVFAIGGEALRWWTRRDKHHG